MNKICFYPTTAIIEPTNSSFEGGCKVPNCMICHAPILVGTRCLEGLIDVVRVNSDKFGDVETRTIHIYVHDECFWKVTE